MDDHFASKSVWVLAFVMRMIPMSSGRISDKGIRVRVAWLNGTRCDTGSLVTSAIVVARRRRLTYSVIDTRAFLEHSMEMQRSCLIAQIVMGSNYYGITHVCFDGRDSSSVSLHMYIEVHTYGH